MGKWKELANNAELYLSKNYRFALIVSDTLLSISFFYTNGLFDYRRSFICRSGEAIRWGLDLFE